MDLRFWIEDSRRAALNQRIYDVWIEDLFRPLGTGHVPEEPNPKSKIQTS